MRRTLILFCTASLILAAGTRAQTPHEVLPTTDNAYNPVPSPNGKYLAYVRTGWGRGMVTGFGRASLISDVALIHTQGTLKPTLVANDFFLSGWTPDSKRVVCYRDGNYALVSAHGQQVLRGRIPNYSPLVAGGWVAYLPSLATLLWSEAGVIRTPSATIVGDIAPAQRVVPSPDGRYLAVFPSASQGQLRIYDLRLKSWRNLGPISIHPDQNWTYIQPDWNPWFPDSSHLVFLTGLKVVIASPDGITKTEIRIHGPAGLPVPAPDGDLVAYVTFEPRPMKMRPDLQFWGGTTIWVISPSAGSTPRAVTKKSSDEVYDLKWLSNQTVVFDRVADEVFYRHARIWKATVPESAHR